MMKEFVPEALDVLLLLFCQRIVQKSAWCNNSLHHLEYLDLRQIFS